jgi:hypothetical protein
MTELPRGEWDDDPDGPPSPEEEAEARALAAALASPDPHPARDLAEALRSLDAPGPLDPATHEQILARALAAAPAGRVIVVPASRWQRSALVAAVLVAAACALLVVGKARPRAAPPALVASRSTQELFDEPFARSGGSSARVDRIAAARGRELRQNRFASWGVR